ISAISGGLVMSAGEYAALTENSFSMPERSFSIAALSPNPLIMTLAPSRASAWAMASPIPEVEPVTTAAFPFSMATFLSVCTPTSRQDLRQGLAQRGQTRASRLSDAPSTRKRGRPSHQLRLGRRRHRDRAATPDILVVGVEKAPGGALAELAQHREELEVGLELAARIERVVVHDNAMQPDPAIAAQFQRSQLCDQRCIEGDLVDARNDLAGCGRHLVALARIDLH